MERLNDDRNDLLSGRSVIGKMMFHDRGNDFDTVPTHTKVRTAEIAASENMNVRFGDMFIKGKPGSHTLPLTFRYYMNGRFPNYSDAQSYVPKGETRTAGVIIINQSDLYNQRIVPERLYSLGNSISFEFEDNHLGTDVELYSISFSAEERSIIRSPLVGNVSAENL